jgi:hypothetical protein
MRQIRENRDPYRCCSMRSKEGPKRGPFIWKKRNNRTSAMLFHAVQGGNQRQGPPCGIYERIEDPYRCCSMRSKEGPKKVPFIWEKRKNTTPSQSCSIHSESAPKTGPFMRNIRENRAPQQIFQCGPGWEPKTGPSMRDTEENRANLAMLMHGATQQELKTGPSMRRPPPPSHQRVLNDLQRTKLSRSEII